MGEDSKSVRPSLQRSLEDDVEPWGRQEGESEVAFEAFRTYRDMDPTVRTLTGTARALGKAKQTLGPWSKKWDWKRRARAWDNHQDQAMQEAMIAERRKMGKRHAQQAQTFMRLLLEPAVALAKKLSDPEFVERFRNDLTSRTPSEALALIRACAAAYPSLMRAERLAMGESTERVEGKISVLQVKSVALRLAAIARQFIPPERLEDYLEAIRVALENELGE